MYQKGLKGEGVQRNQLHFENKGPFWRDFCFIVDIQLLRSDKMTRTWTSNSPLFALIMYSMSLPCVNTWAHNYYNEKVLTYSD